MTIYEIIGFSLLFIGIMELFLGIALLRNNPRHSPVQKAVTALALFSASASTQSSAHCAWMCHGYTGPSGPTH